MYLPEEDLYNLHRETADLLAASTRARDTKLAVGLLIGQARIELRLGQLRDAQATLAQLDEILTHSEGVEGETERLLIQTELLYARGRTPQARRTATVALQSSIQKGNPWDIIELFLIVAGDLRGQAPAHVVVTLNTIAHDGNVHFDQRRRAQLAGGSNSGPGSLLSVSSLQAWLQEQLDRL
ncbi:hypothetical protein ACFOUS_13440 [Deinococcus metalli]|uniref:hypothetical protein n=1 Tax=Deinococcus metalli TaxID=1141878 RepID=UPI003623A3FD